MKSYYIKKLFFDYFKENKHIEIEEYPLVPLNDKSLLFTNSGMVQFKNIFLGLDKVSYDKVVTSQRCIRLSGKHDDLGEIGKSLYHNTSFEMLGNFSFNNSSKLDTLKLCWNFLIDILKIDREKLYVTVHSNDFEVFNYWHKDLGLKKEHILFGSDESNFWSMDEFGPCGYCTEIFYNISEENCSQNLLEIWNIVFINFNKTKNGLLQLDNFYVDTGMGLERITSVMQKTFNNYDIDFYKDLFNLFVKKYNISDSYFKIDAIRLILDHLKTSIFLILDGVLPSNDNRGYILKKLLRRSFLKKRLLGINDKLSLIIEDFIDIIFFKKTVSYSNKKFIIDLIEQEELKFFSTLNTGICILNKIIVDNKFDEKLLFVLYDTYGLPLDIIKEVLKDFNIDFSFEKFNIEMKKQRERSKNSRVSLDLNLLPRTQFYGYENNFLIGEVLALFKFDIKVDVLNQGEFGIIILDKTCFYAEKGGQISDKGIIKCKSGVFLVNDVKEFNGIYLHYGYVDTGSLNVKSFVNLSIDCNHRFSCSVNHTSTHLLHSVLKNFLGQHVKQAGSLVSNNYLRFDFLHFKPISKNDLLSIEYKINNIILSNFEVLTDIYLDDFTNEYVRTVKIGGNVSIEKCGGTHVKRTGEIGLFKIVKEYGIGSNVRRIEAITGFKIIEKINYYDKLILNFSNKLKTDKDNLENKFNLFFNKCSDLSKENSLLLCDILKKDIFDKSNIIFFKNIKVIVLFKDLKFLNILKNIVSSLEKVCIIIYYNNNGKNFVNITISKDVNLNTNDIVTYIRQYISVIGGGNSFAFNGLINDFDSFSKHLLSYFENEYKCEENNVNFN